MYYKRGDYVICEGQIVKIVDVLFIQKHAVEHKRYKIKLINDTSSYWVDAKYLEPLNKQQAAKVLFD